MKSALSAKQADRPFKPLYFSQLPGEHYRGAVIANDPSI